MLMMEINRRNFIKSFLYGLSFSLIPFDLKASNINKNLLISCYTDNNNNNYVCIFDLNGNIKFNIRLSFRGHSFAYNKFNNHLIVFGRRPSFLTSVVNLNNGNKILDINSIKNRHFYGHGCFSHCYNYLITTENDFKNHNGIISIRDVNNNYKLIKEFNSYGKGPHEILLLNNKNIIVVANGGIKTHPKTARKKLNIHNMESNISFIDFDNGKLLEQYKLKDQYQSIRHITVSKNNDVYFSTQYQSKINDSKKIVGVVRSNKIELFDIENKFLEKFKNYSGSVKFDEVNNLLVVSHPRGNRLSFWDAKKKVFIKTIKFSDVCGIAVNQNKIFVSNGYGDLRKYYFYQKNFFTEYFQRKINLKWDNHMEII